MDASNTRGVYIGIIYLGMESHAINPSFPSVDVFKLISTADDGSHTLTSTDFTGMPAGGVAKLFVGRGNSITVTNGGQDYVVNAYTMSGGQINLVP